MKLLQKNVYSDKVHFPKNSILPCLPFPPIPHCPNVPTNPWRKRRLRSWAKAMFGSGAMQEGSDRCVKIFVWRCCSQVQGGARCSILIVGDYRSIRR